MARQERSDQQAAPQEEAEARFVRLAPALLGIAGLVGSVLLALGLRHSESARARSEFELDAATLMAAASRELQVNLEQVHATAALFRSSEVVETHEFRTFTAPSFTRYPGLRALFWIEGGTGTTSSPGVRLSEGPEAGDYPPGRDLGPDAVLTAALARAAETGSLTVSEPVRGATRVVALEPLLEDGGMRGFVAGLYDLTRLFGHSRIALGPTELLLGARDAFGGELPLTADFPRAEAQPRRTLELGVGGRTWILTSAAPAGYLAARMTWRPWIALALGLLATGALVATLVMASGRARIQRLVAGRTEEVKKAYATLSFEAKERLWAENERHQAEQQLRAVIDLVPDQIFVKDALGRYLLANTSAAAARGTTVGELTLTRYVDRNEAPVSPKEPLSEEQRAMLEHKATILPTHPFTDADGRRRILRQTMLPCDVFGVRLGAMLCVATDITEQKHAENMLRAQNRLLAELARGEDPEHVLSQIVDAAEELVPGMRASVLLMAPDGRHLRHGFAPSLPSDYNEAIDGLEIGPEVGSCGAAACLAERVVVADVMTHRNWAPYRDLAKRSGIGACWSQPILAADRTVLGTFALYYSEARSPEPFEERFLEAMAHMAGIAIEHVRSESRS